LPGDGRRIVFGVVGHDIHVVANRIIEIGLRELGFDAYNLGTNNLPEDFVAASLEVEAHAVLVSSINGEGEYWCAHFRPRFTEAGLDDILLYIGGNLVIGDRNEDEVVGLFRSFGFDRVFYRTRNLTAALRQLAGDLSHGRA
jgi:methylaspartate mutase sigma subunit